MDSVTISALLQRALVYLLREVAQGPVARDDLDHWRVLRPADLLREPAPRGEPAPPRRGAEGRRAAGGRPGPPPGPPDAPGRGHQAQRVPGRGGLAHLPDG